MVVGETGCGFRVPKLLEPDEERGRDAAEAK